MKPLVYDQDAVEQENKAKCLRASAERLRHEVYARTDMTPEMIREAQLRANELSDEANEIEFAVAVYRRKRAQEANA